MALEKQTTSFPWVAGLDEKTGRRHLTPPKLLDATNVRFDKSGEICKRAGMVAACVVPVEPADIDGLTPDAGSKCIALAPLGELLCVVGGREIGTLTKTSGGVYAVAARAELPAYTTREIESATVQYPSPAQYAVPSAATTVNGYTVTVWLESTTLEAIATSADGRQVARFTQPTAVPFFNTLAVASGQYATIAWMDVTGGNIVIRLCSFDDTTLAFSAVWTITVNALATAGQALDMSASGDGEIHVIACQTTTTASAYRILDHYPFTTISTDPMYAAGAGEEIVGVAHDVLRTGSPATRAALGVFAYNATSGIYRADVFMYNPQTAALISSIWNPDDDTVPVTGIAVLPAGLCIAQYDVTAVRPGFAQWSFHEDNGPITFGPFVSYACAPVSRPTYVPAYGVVGVMVAFGGAEFDTSWVLVRYQHDDAVSIQVDGTLLAVSPVILASASQRTQDNAGYRTPYQLSSWGGRLAFATGERDTYNRPIVVRTVLFEPYAVEPVGFASRVSYELRGGLHIPGGVPTRFDREVAVGGFPAAPVLSLAPYVSSTRPGVTGTFTYVAVYTFTDDLGQVHYSTPSSPATITVTAPQEVIAHVSNCWIAAVPITRVVTYLYEVDTAGVATLVRILTATGDVDRQQNMQDAADPYVTASLIYTAGNVLDAVFPPSARVVLTHQNRVFWAGCQDPTMVYYSTRNEADFVAPYCSDALIIVAPFAVTAMASLDDQLYLFGDMGVAVVSGNGPDATGGGGSYSEPRLLPFDVGAVDQRSIATGGAGVSFLSKRGLFIMGRGLETQFLGAPVEDWTRLLATCTSAAVSERDHEVRWTFCAPDAGSLGSGRTLRFNTLFNQWSADSHTLATSTDEAGCHAAAMVGGVYWHAFDYDFSGGVSLRYEDRSRFYDQGYDGDGAVRNVRYPLTVETGNASFAGVQGWQRVWRVGIQARYLTSHDVTITEYANAASAATVATTWVNADIAAAPSEALLHHVVQQKATATRFRVDLTPAGVAVDGTDEGAVLEASVFEYGTKQGAVKVGPTQRG